MQKTWRSATVAALSLIGAAVATYLTAVHLRHLRTGAKSACTYNQLFDCDVVNTSRFSELLDVPISHLGLLFYLGMGILAVLALRQPAQRSRLQGYLFLGTLLANVASLFLAGVSFLLLRAACVFCISLYAVNLVTLFVLWPGGWSALRALPTHGAKDAHQLLRPWVLLAALFVAAATYQIRGAVQAAHVEAEIRQNSVRIDLQDAAAPSIGKKDASITLVEVSDFECPFCQRAAETVAELRRLYPDSLRVVFRNFPIDKACNPLVKQQVHENACAAARAALCANAQGQFWPYAELLFGGATEPADLRQHVRTLGLDEAAFGACLDAPATAARVANDIAACTRAGITGVPVFFINGRRLAGAKPLAEFRALIDDELNSRRDASLANSRR